MPEPPRVNREQLRSRHAAADPECCEEMARKYKWKLVDVVRTGNKQLPVDCVFDGETAFPKTYYEKEEG